ncbi:MAG: HipA-like protein, partial [Waterburya sp.]
MPQQFPIVFVRQEDFQLSQDETMGTKSKFWFKHPKLDRCLYKQIRPNTGEDWAEKIASELCELLGLPHARYELAETWEGNYGTVSLNFIPQGGTLIHGNEILTPLVPNYPTYETYNASQHTINLVISAIESSPVQLPSDWRAPDGIETARDLFVGYLLLDAWIGNGDRHHENWGFVRSSEANILYLSPTYD